MSNEEKRKDNDSIREINKQFNQLNRAITKKSEIVAETPSLSKLEEIKQSNSIDIVEDEKFSNLVEQVAILQFAGKERDEIMEALEIDKGTLKNVIMSEDFAECKRLIAEDNRVVILSKVLNRIDEAMDTLSDLMGAADEDRVRLNAAALIVEHASRMLEEQRRQMPSINNVIKEAATSGEPVAVRLAEVILNQRKERQLV